jgi:hypothetical protein
VKLDQQSFVQWTVIESPGDERLFAGQHPLRDERR